MCGLQLLRCTDQYSSNRGKALKLFVTEKSELNEGEQTTSGGVDSVHLSWMQDVEEPDQNVINGALDKPELYDNDSSIEIVVEDQPVSEVDINEMP